MAYKEQRHVGYQRNSNSMDISTIEKDTYFNKYYKRLQTTSIWPLKLNAIDGQMDPSLCFESFVDEDSHC
jgi:hypothetical protein